MIIDGKKIANAIKTQLAQEAASFGEPPILGILQVGDDPVISRYIGMKKRFGEEIGVEVVVTQLPVDSTEEIILEAVEDLSKSSQGEHRGVIVQLPLPSNIRTEVVLDAVPLGADVDMLSSPARDNFEDGSSPILPPVVGAIAEILKLHHFELAGRRVVLVGYGRLVGQPVATWLRHENADVELLTKADDTLESLKEAEMIISGTGVADLIKPEMVREGVVLVDVGTSEEAGELRGDIDPTCAIKASIYTPVPGGIGPLTVAMLFKNLLTLAANS